MIAERDQQILIQFLCLIDLLEFNDLVQIQTGQLQIQRVRQNLRLVGILLIREGTGVARQIIIDLHEAQGNKTVEPCIGNLLHRLPIAIPADQTYQRLPLLNLSRSQHHAVYVLSAFIENFLFRDAELLRLLGHTGDQLPSSPDSVFLNCILIHGVLTS